MSDIENAIRKKLSQVDASDASARRQVYEAVWNAHEQYLIANININDDDRTRRRNNLTALIKNIEQDFHAPSTRAIFEENSHSQGAFSAPDTRDAPQNVSNSSSWAPNAIHPDNDRVFYKPEKRKGRGLILTLIGLVVLLILGAATWFYAQNFLSEAPFSSQQENVSKQNSAIAQNAIPAETANKANDVKTSASIKTQAPLKTNRPVQEKTRPLSQDLLSDDSKRSDDGWVRVFTPNDVVGLEVKGGAKAQIINTDGDSYVRISSQAINDTTVINIGSGALDPLRGHTITVDILARSNTDKPSQLIATCDFGNKIECGRIRFEVSAMRDDFLFNVKLPANSSGPGKIYLTSDYSNKDQSIDIYRVFIRKND